MSVEQRGVSLEQLAGRANTLRGNIERARSIVSTLGTDDPTLFERYPRSAEKFHLNPRNIVELQRRLPRVVKINQRLLGSIESQTQELDTTAFRVSQRITEEGSLSDLQGQLSAVNETIPQVQVHAEKGILSPKIVEELQARAQELDAILDLNRKGTQLLEEKSPKLPEEILNCLSPLQRKAAETLPFLPSLPLPPGFGVTYAVVARALYPGSANTPITPKDKEWRNAKEMVSDVRKKIEPEYMVASVQRRGGPSKLFITTPEVARQLVKQKQNGEPEIGTKFQFPNGEELVLSPSEVNLARAVPYYPRSQASIPSSTLAELMSVSHRELGDIIAQARDHFIKAGVVIVNETPRAIGDRRGTARYFAVAVNLGEPLTEAEKRIALAVFKKYIATESIDLVQLQEDVFGDHDIEVLPKVREQIRPFYSKEAIATFVSAFVKMVKIGAEPTLWEQEKAKLCEKGILKRATAREVNILLHKIAHEIGNAESYLLAGSQTQPLPEPLVALPLRPTG